MADWEFESTYGECWSCGGSGESEHDCFDDTCCCLNPEPDTCEVCKGEGYLKVRKA